VNSDLRRIIEWSRVSLLRLNPAKSMVLPIFRGHLLAPLPPRFLSDDFIPYVYKAKNLGVTFSYDLSWGDHVITVCRKFYGALAGWLLPLFLFVCDLLLPLLIHFSFTTIVYTCVRCVYRRRLFDHISDVSSLGLL
jgi:hypothetical protein